MKKKTGKILLRDALIDAMLREVDRDMEKCEESPICSPEHYKRMSEIVGFDVTKPRRKRRMSARTKIAIIIIAAVVALTGCVAAIYSRQIGNFIEEFYDKYIKVHFVNETTTSSAEIEDIYTLSYVPKGYSLTNSEITSAWIKLEYNNYLNETIIFKQYVLSDTCNLIDLEHGYTQAIQIDTISIYHKKSNNVNVYKWKNDMYSFAICDRNSLSQSEIIKIINGLKTK